MVWWSVVPTALAGLLVFWAPGVVVLAAARVRGLPLLALAPAVTAGVLLVGSLLGPSVGIAWGILPVAVTTGVFGLGAYALARRRPTTPPTAVATQPGIDPQARPRRWLLPVAVIVAVAALVVPVAIGMGRPDRVQNAWDALFHLAAVQSARLDGRVDPWWLASLADPGGTTTLYPSAWHAAASLVPQWAGPLVAVNVSAVLPGAVATVLGATILTRELFPTARSAPVVAALLTASGVAVPQSPALQPGLIPNAFALSLVPAALAVVVAAQRRRDAGVPVAALLPGALVLAGIGGSHPGALLGLALLSAPWALDLSVRWLRSAWRTPTGRLRVAGAAALIGVGILAITRNPTTQIVTGINQKPPLPASELAVRLLTGNLGEWPSYAIVPTALAVGASAWLLRRRERAPVIALVLAVAAYLCAASSLELLSSLTNLWYSEERRVAPLVAAMVVPLAAYGLILASRAVIGRVVLPAAISAGGAQVLVAAVAVTICIVPGVQAMTGLAVDTFTQEMPDQPQLFDRKPYLSPDEELMLDRLASDLDRDELLLGSSFSGAGHLAALTGQRVVQPYHATALSPGAIYISTHLTDILSDPQVCDAVRELGARYVYVDPYPLHSTYWRTAGYGSFTQAPPPSVEPLDAAGSAAVYRLDLCY